MGLVKNECPVHLIRILETQTMGKITRTIAHASLLIYLGRFPVIKTSTENE